MSRAKVISFFCLVFVSLQNIQAADDKQGKASVVSKGPVAELKTSEILPKTGLTQDQMDLRNQAVQRQRNAYQSLRNRTSSPSNFPSAISKGTSKNFLKSKDLVLSPNFTAGTVAESGFVPPDANGYVGTKQFIACLNGLIRSFHKDGKADGVLNLSTNSFFASVLPQVSGAFTFTSDPRIIFDNSTKRWFITMISVSLDESSGDILPDNQLLLAVSDGKRDGKITDDTVWSFYSFFPGSIPPQSDWLLGFGYIADAPSLGIDKHALYVGNNVFSANDEFLTADLFVINKESLLKKKELKITPFRDVANFTGAGMFAPEGVTNFDEDAKEGFFLGADAFTLNTLHLRRIIHPGSDTPLISTDIEISIPVTQMPLPVPAKGSINPIDANDNRIQQTHVRDKRLYTSQTIAVDQNGSSKGSVDRDGCRWYEFSLKNPNKPKLLQFGTLFDPRTTPLRRFYFYPSVMTNKHHTMILGCTVAGENFSLNAAVTYRHANDAKGTLHKVKTFTNRKATYNLQTTPTQRWGDYSISSPDPEDSSLWTIQEFCNSTDSWGCRVTRLHKKEHKQ